MTGDGDGVGASAGFAVAAVDSLGQVPLEGEELAPQHRGHRRQQQHGEPWPVGRFVQGVAARLRCFASPMLNS